MGMTTVYYRVSLDELEQLRSDYEFFNSIIENRDREYFDMYKLAYPIALGLNPLLLGYEHKIAAIEADAVCTILLGMDGEAIHEESGYPGLVIKGLLIHTALNELEGMDKKTVKEHFAVNIVDKQIAIDNYDDFFENEIWGYLTSFEKFLKETARDNDILLLVGR